MQASKKFSELHTEKNAKQGLNISTDHEQKSYHEINVNNIHEHIA